MEKADILKYLQKAEVPGDISFREMKAEAEAYPYFQPFYFILLKYLKKNNTYEFENSLKKWAIQISDRRKLYLYLNSDGFLRNEEVEEEVQTELLNPTNTIIQTEELPSESKEINNEISSSRREEKDTLKESISDTLDNQTKFEASNVSETTILPEVHFELDENIEIIKPETSDIKGNPIVSSAHDFTEAIQHIDDSAIQFIEEGEYIQSQDETTFTEKAENIIDSFEVNDFVGVTAMSDEEYHTFTSWFDHLEGNNSENQKNAEPVTENEPLENLDLIDKFLKEEPRIKPKPITATEQEDISVASTEEHEDLMTETLARIYIKQGNYSKAISAYEKLSLKFPEKKTYFAAQIEEIKNIDNQ